MSDFFDCLVTFDLSESGQKEALSKGLPATSNQTTTIQLPIALLLSNDHIRIDRDGKARLDSNLLRSERFSHIPGEADILACLMKAKKKQEEEERAERELAEKIKTSDAVIQIPYNYEVPGFGRTMSPSTLSKYLSKDEIDLVNQGIATRKKAKEAEREAKRKAQEEAAERVRAEKLAKAKAWIDRHGSSRLKKLFEGGFSWMPVAKEEWAALNLPEGFSIPDGDVDVKDRTSPTELEIDDLNHWSEIQKTSTNLISVKLSWNVPEDDAEPAYASLDLQFETPFQTEVTFEKKYADE